MKAFSRAGALRAERLVRIVADTLLVPSALFLAFATRILFFVAIGGDLLASAGGAGALWSESLRLFWPGAILLTPLSLLTFHLHGFYTKGRYYAGRYKAIIIFQAVTTVFLAYATAAYAFGLVPAPPRGAFLAAYFWVLALVGGARLWVFVWRWASPGEEPVPSRRRGGNVARVLVIGGAGYIGSALVPLLLRRGLKVHVLDALLYGESPLDGVLGHPRLTVTKGDFRNVNTVVAACKDVDAVVHLGGIVGDPACAVDERLTIDVNLSATRMIANVAKGVGVERFVFASTCSVYGACDDLLDERSALHPVSLYARTKIASERVLLELQSEALPVVLLRFATIFGLSGRTRFDLVVNLLTAQAVVDRRITVMGGDQWRPFVHVHDAANSIVAALAGPPEITGGQVFNVGTDRNNMRIQDVGELVHRLVPEAELVSLPHDGDRRNYRVSFNKIRRDLDFDPEWSVEAGVKQVIEVFRRGTVSDFRDPRYSNYQSLVKGIVTLPLDSGEWEDDYLASIGR